MQFKTLFSAAALLAIGVKADFSILVIEEQDQIPGSGARFSAAGLLAERSPDCANVCGAKLLQSPDNDATRNAWACTGCSAGQNAADYDISEFEFNNNNVEMFNEDVGFITVRRQGDGSYQIAGRASTSDAEQTRDGESCTRETQFIESCQCSLAVREAAKLFWCSSALTARPDN